MTEENFKDYPQSLAELKSDRSANAADWTPRDALIAMLRDIDNGQIHPDALIVCYRDRVQNGDSDTTFVQASPDLHTTLGLLEICKHRILSHL